MRNTARTGTDRETLERLRGDEVALERELAAARADAAAAVESARREAERIASVGRQDVERVRDALRAEEAAGLAAEAVQARGALAVELGALAERAGSRQARALERVLAVVLGRRE